MFWNLLKKSIFQLTALSNTKFQHLLKPPQQTQNNTQPNHHSNPKTSAIKTTTTTSKQHPTKQPLQLQNNTNQTTTTTSKQHQPTQNHHKTLTRIFSLELQKADQIIFTTPAFLRHKFIPCKSFFLIR